MYLGLNPLGMEKWAAFITAPLALVWLLYWYAVHWNQRNRTLSCGSIFRPVCFPEIPSTFVDDSHDRSAETNVDQRWSMLTVRKVFEHSTVLYCVRRLSSQLRPVTGWTTFLLVVSSRLVLHCCHAYRPSALVRHNLVFCLGLELMTTSCIWTHNTVSDAISM